MTNDTQKADILMLNDGIRSLLSVMHFPAIPEEAEAIAFFADGQAQFLTNMQDLGSLFALGNTVFVSYRLFRDMDIQL